MDAPLLSPGTDDLQPDGLDQPAPRALVVYESMFDATTLLAESVVRGLTGVGFVAQAVGVHSPVATLPVRVDLLIVGAPTHLLSLSRPITRQEAVRQGAEASRAPIGLREWIAHARPALCGTDRVAVFDSRQLAGTRLPLGAAHTAAKLLAGRGFAMVGRPGHFGTHRGAPLLGEHERAEAWAATTGSAAVRRRALSSRP